MYKIKKLEKEVWTRKIFFIKKRYEEHSQPDKLPHLKKMIEENKIFCYHCGESLESYIGKEIVMSHRTPRSRWLHIECSRKERII